MAVSTGVSLQSVLGTLVGSTTISTVTAGGDTVTGTISVVGTDVLIYSPATGNTTSVVIPFSSIDRVITP